MGDITLTAGLYPQSLRVAFLNQCLTLAPTVLELLTFLAACSQDLLMTHITAPGCED